MSPGLHRRRFIQIMPVAGAGLLAACSDKPAEPPAPAAPPPAPAPEPAPAPAAAPATPAPAPAPATAAQPAAPAPAPAPAAPGTSGSLPMLDEKEAAAVALAYVADNSRVDRARHANFTPEQNCANCALYQGAAGSAAGACPLFAGKWVAAKGWCTAWARRS